MEGDEELSLGGSAPGSFGEMPGAATRWAGIKSGCDRWKKMGKVWAPFVSGNAADLRSLRHQFDWNRPLLANPIVDVLLRGAERVRERPLAPREWLGLNGSLKGGLAHGSDNYN